MEAFVSRKRRKLSPAPTLSPYPHAGHPTASLDEDDSTDIKLAMLASLYPGVDQSTLLDLLIGAEGSVEAVSQALTNSTTAESSPRKKENGSRSSGIGHQASLSSFRLQQQPPRDDSQKRASTKLLTRKGQTLHLYTPEDIAAHTPCSIIHNFLPSQEAEDLLRELLQEATTFEKQTFKLFDNVVQSPHSACFYVESLEEQQRQKTEYVYNGSYLTVCRPFKLLFSILY